MVIQFGASESRLLRLLRLAGGGSRTEQFQLSPIGIEPRLDFVRGVGDVGTNPLQGVAKPIEVRITLTRTGKIAFQAVQYALPAGRRGLEIDAQLLVHALDDFRRVDPGVDALDRGFVVRGGVYVRRLACGWRR